MAPNNGLGSPVEWATGFDEPWSSPQAIPPGANSPVRKLAPGAGPMPTMGLPRVSSTKIVDPNHYAKLIDGNSAPGVAGAPNTLAPFLYEASTKRNLLGLRNASATGGANIYIGFGAVATGLSWLVLVPGQIIVFDESVPQNDLYATADAAGAVLCWSVSTIDPGPI